MHDTHSESQWFIWHMAPSILLGQTMKHEASTSRLFTVRARHSKLCTAAVPPSPRCGLAHLCKTVQDRGGLWFQPGAMLGLVIISRWHQHEQQMPSWPQGLNVYVSVCVRACVCVCLYVCMLSDWCCLAGFLYLLPPHLCLSVFMPWVSVLFLKWPFVLMMIM